jgi:hypothetical protein
MHVAGRLEDNKRDAEVAEHLKNCEFCSEIADEFQDYLSLVYEDNSEIPVRAYHQAETLYYKAIQGSIISLKHFETDSEDDPVYLAADGTDEATPEITNLATFYADDPEIILRVMRNNRENRDYLELIGDDPFQSSNVLVQIPEINRDFVTDSSGIASLADLDEKNYDKYSWQIKMPDAVFHLEPLQYDPDKTEYSKQIELDTDQGDKIGIRFEGKTEGKKITLSILQLEGKTDIGELKVLVSQEDMRLIKSVSDKDSVVFNLANQKSGIDIRLFKQ